MAFFGSTGIVGGVVGAGTTVPGAGGITTWPQPGATGPAYTGSPPQPPPCLPHEKPEKHFDRKQQPWRDGAQVGAQVGAHGAATGAGGGGTGIGAGAATGAQQVVVGQAGLQQSFGQWNVGQ